MKAGMANLPIMRPKLPTAKQLAPYLQMIDSTRLYTNFGPLTNMLEERLSDRFDTVPGTVTTIANATLGLALALNALRAAPGTFCVMPAWTFIASAHAARLAGLVPYFLDVDHETWALNPDAVADMIASAPGPVGAVMPVAPFGRPIDIAAWEVFKSRTGVPAVIDAAAGFDAIVPSTVPAVVSLHATKILGAGEGGFVMSADANFIREIRTRSNFGFFNSREAVLPGTNAKLSEYSAAVALAALDEWTQVREEWMIAARAYHAEFARSNRAKFQDGFGSKWATSTCVLELTDIDASEAKRKLAVEGIETRQWWGQGAHMQSAMTSFPRTALPNTEALARSTIAVPFFRDIDLTQVQRVAKALLEA